MKFYLCLYNGENCIFCHYQKDWFSQIIVQDFVQFETSPDGTINGYKVKKNATVVKSVPYEAVNIIRQVNKKEIPANIYGMFVKLSNEYNEHLTSKAG